MSSTHELESIFRIFYPWEAPWLLNARKNGHALEKPIEKKVNSPLSPKLSVIVGKSIKHEQRTKMSQPIPAQRTNGLSIAAFVMSLVGFSVIAAIMGHVAMGQIKRTGDAGNGLAIAAVVIGWLSFASILFWIFVFGAALTA
jgi:hypothetical protein